MELELCLIFSGADTEQSTSSPSLAESLASSLPSEEEEDSCLEAGLEVEGVILEAELEGGSCLVSGRAGLKSAEGEVRLLARPVELTHTKPGLVTPLTPHCHCQAGARGVQATF